MSDIKAINTIRIINTQSSKSKSFFRMSLGLFVASFILQLVISSKFAVKNKDLQLFINEKREISKEVAHLEYEDSLLSSLEGVELKALSLGFVPMKSSIRVIDSLKLASLRPN